MLSILIPIYNFPCTTLVKELVHQAGDLECAWELILMDDNSSQHREENKCLQEIAGVRYIELPQNIGRSAIRNRLADEAQFTYLLFMDCDSQLVNRSFLSTYLAAAKKTFGVICGGHSYAPSETIAQKHLLHHTYGVHRECSVREKTTFLSHNFLAHKSVFETVRFDETLSQYGHEDTLFGVELVRNGFTITHIENRPWHIGLEENTIFIKKSIQAATNLAYITQQRLTPEECKTIRLVRTYNSLKACYLTTLFIKFTTPLISMFKRNLCGKHPRLMLLDIIKLNAFCIAIKR